MLLLLQKTGKTKQEREQVFSQPRHPDLNPLATKKTPFPFSSSVRQLQPRHDVHRLQLLEQQLARVGQLEGSHVIGGPR